MKILTIPRLVHDTSICIFEDGKIIHYAMEERFSRKKHDFNFENILNLVSEEKYNNIDNIFILNHFLDLDHKCNSNQKIINKLPKYYSKNIFIQNSKHHIYHAYCGFYNSGFNEAICLSLDGSGAILNDGKIEVESVYYLNKNLTEKEIYKKNREFMSLNHENYYEYYKQISYDSLSVGEKFFKMSERLKYDLLDGAGKIMGLAQYKNNKNKLQHPYNTKEWKENVDDSYNLQQETQNYVLNLIETYTKIMNVKNVVISGGYGLNCVANYFYLKNLKDINLYIDPICFDAGISIGAAYYHYLQSSKNLPPIQPLKNVYIGHQETNYDLSGLNVQKASYDDVVNLLLQKNVVALFQGKSEAGQRSLGNRSLLFDPRNPKGKDVVNQIKRRENFRPFAGTILLEEASKWFNMLSLKESPYMQYAVDAYQNAIEQVPSIIHADNTCRIQTVTKKQNLHFYNLISCFFKKTNVPMLLNTSFNLGGEPLVETFEQAIHTLRNSKIEYLYLPEIEQLITIKNKNLSYQ